MHLTCPHCQNPIEVVEPAGPDEIVCPSCGSSFPLESDRTRTYLAHERRLGKFELIEELGVGAHGIVFKARDTELDRVVAVKIPRAGSLATQADIDRFLREARSAAQLRHPGIVTLHDAGQADGTCYLVSEYVQGATLADRLETGRLGFRQAAELVAEVADAVQFAHEQGVIHRDLKPSNIMLDFDGRPHVMDFGLAKRDAGEITMTLDGQVLGTPAYMSPEQAKGESHRVDTRSDVYSLGVILYELLTGELPFRGNKRMLIVQVLHDEPRPPRRLNDHIPRDLETITLKCMAKEPARRYATAANLAADLRHWLAGEPIQARPVGNWEQLWRWCLRNPRVAALSSAVFLLLLAVAVGSSIAATLIAEQRRASDAERRQRLVALTQRDVALDALDALNQLIFGEDQLQDTPAIRKLRRDLLGIAMDAQERVRQVGGDDASPSRNVAVEHRRMGDICLDLEGATDKALEHYQEALRINQALLAAHPLSAEAKGELAISYDKLGDVSRRLGDLAAAWRYFDDSLKLREELAARDPQSPAAKRDVAISYDKLGQVDLRLGELATARQYFERGLTLSEQLVAAAPQSIEAKRDLAVSYNRLGDVSLKLDDAEAARAYYMQSLELRQTLAAADPRSALAKRDLSISYQYLGRASLTLGDAAAARGYVQEGLELRKALAEADPDNAQAKRDLALSYDSLANATEELGDAAGALRYYEDSLKLREALATKDPQNAEAKRDWAGSCNNVGEMSLHMGDMVAARTHFEKSLEIREALAATDPQDAQTQIYLSDSYANCGHLAQQAKAYEEAVQWFEKARSVLKRLESANKLSPADKRKTEAVEQAIAECKMAIADSKGQ